MKNQSRTIKTNPELYRVVMDSSGGHRRLPGGSDDFSLQTNRQTLHHNIYIINIIVIILQVRIICIIAYFAPFLGLLNCLAHWKADQLLQRGASEYTDYTGIALGPAFIIFVVMMVLQSVIIFCVKMHMSEGFCEAVWSCKLQHVVEVLNMPGNIQVFFNWPIAPLMVFQGKTRKKKISAICSLTFFHFGIDLRVGGGYLKIIDTM